MFAGDLLHEGPLIHTERADASADVKVHLALVKADRSPPLRRMHPTLTAEAHFRMARVQANQLLRADVIADEHGEILGPIDAGDVEGVRRRPPHTRTMPRDKLLASMIACGCREPCHGL